MVHAGAAVIAVKDQRCGDRSSLRSRAASRARAAPSRSSGIDPAVGRRGGAPVHGGDDGAVGRVRRAAAAARARRRPSGSATLGAVVERRVDHAVGSSANSTRASGGAVAAGTARPPDDRVVLGPGQRDVEQPQALARRLGLGERLAVLRRGLVGPAARPWPGRTCAGRCRGPGRSSRGCGVRHIVGQHTIGNSRPFATHTVMICTAWASDSIRREARSRSMSASTSIGLGASSTASRPATLARGRTAPWLQQLGEVVEVGHRAVAVGTGEDPGRHAALGPDPTARSRRSTRRRASRPSVELLLHLGQLVVGGRVDPLGAAAAEPGQRERAARGVGRTGAASASSSQRHCSAAGDSSTLSPRASTAGTPWARAPAAPRRPRRRCARARRCRRAAPAGRAPVLALGDAGVVEQVTQLRTTRSP